MSIYCKEKRFKWISNKENKFFYKSPNKSVSSGNYSSHGGASLQWFSTNNRLQQLTNILTTETELYFISYKGFIILATS